jgi:resuscitation-promoting factor RpfB
MKKLIAISLLTFTLVFIGSVTAPTATAAASTTVTLKVGNGKAKIVRTKARTVGQLLAQRKVTLGVHDWVSPSLTTKLTRSTKIKVVRVNIHTATVTEKVTAVVKKNNASLKRGKTKVLVSGSTGKAVRTYSITKVNGSVTKKVQLAETVLVAPTTKVISVGTKGPALNTARSNLWNKIARCESGGRWSINTGNGYYGGLQFNLATWRANGGRDFAAKPHKATKAEQITVANRLYAKRGTRPWGCR